MRPRARARASKRLRPGPTANRTAQVALTPATAIEEIAGQASLHGLDLDESEALRLLNEADTDMCVRGEWTRKRVELGPSVAYQGDYEFDQNEIYRPLRLWVEGAPFEPADEETVGRIGTDTYHRGNGLWYLSESDAGARQISLYPIPTEADLEIMASCIVYPEEFEADGSFNVPPDFRRGLVNYVRWVSLGSSEDDSAAENYGSAYESEVQRLKRHRKAMGGQGPHRMRIKGVTA